MRKSRVAGDKRVRKCGQPGAIAHCTRPHRPLHRRYDAPWRPAARSTCSCARAPGAHAMAHARDPRISPDVLRAILWSRRCVLPLGSSPGVYTVFLFGAREVVNRRHDLPRIFEHGFAGGGFPFIQPACIGFRCVKWSSHSGVLAAVNLADRESAQCISAATHSLPAFLPHQPRLSVPGSQHLGPGVGRVPRRRVLCFTRTVVS